MSDSEYETSLMKIAHFHALSYCYGKSQSTDFKYYPFLFQRFPNDPRKIQQAETNLKLMKQHVLASGTDQDLIPVLDKYLESKDLMKENLNLNSSEYLSHSDYYTSHILVKKNSSGNLNLDSRCLLINVLRYLLKKKLIF